MSQRAWDSKWRRERDSPTSAISFQDIACAGPPRWLNQASCLIVRARQATGLSIAAANSLRIPLSTQTSQAESLARRLWWCGVSDVENGGERGIRTPGPVARSLVFKTSALSHSAISPHHERKPVAGLRCFICLRSGRSLSTLACQPFPTSQRWPSSRRSKPGAPSRYLLSWAGIMT